MKAGFAVGWDIGGANVKVALAGPDGCIERVDVMPCELWRGLDRLATALAEAPLPPPDQIAGHAVTMTGELCDLFSDRCSGVQAIVEAMTVQLSGVDIGFYSLNGELLAAPQAIETWSTVASANWMATAAFAAGHVERGLVIDVGSTTTDIVPMSGGRPVPAATTDATRLQQGELLYAGALRTPVMALVDQVPWAGAWSGVAAELFATSADVYRLTGDIGSDDDPAPAVDGSDKTVAGSARRLARQVGVDFEPALLPAVRLLANHIADRQRERLAAAVDRICSRAPDSLPGTLVGAGVGRFMVSQLAQRRAMRYRDFGELPGMNGRSAAVAAPACVMAVLASRAARAARP